MTCEQNATLTGKMGKFQLAEVLVARITQWSVNPKLASSTEWGDSDSGGYTNRQPGRKDATFSAEGKFDSDDEVYDLFQPGDKLQATLWVNETLYWDFPCAMCSDFGLTVNVDSEEVVGWTSSWGADGKFYYPGETDAPTRTLPANDPWWESP